MSKRALAVLLAAVCELVDEQAREIARLKSIVAKGTA